MTTTLLSDFLPRPRPVPRWSRPRTSSGGFVLRRSLLHCLPVLCTLNNSELCEARGTTVELLSALLRLHSSCADVIDSTLRCTISTRNISCALNFFVLDYSDKGNCTYNTIRDRSNKLFRRCPVKIFLE